MRRLRSQLVQRYALGQKPEQAEERTDKQFGFDVNPLTLIRTMDGLYSEPMVLGAVSSNPSAIEAIRVVDLSGNQEAPVIGAGGVAHFAWKPQLGGAVINSINGMTVAANGGKSYRFTFRVTYAAARGG